MGNGALTPSNAMSNRVGLQGTGFNGGGSWTIAPEATFPAVIYSNHDTNCTQDGAQQRLETGGERRVMRIHTSTTLWNLPCRSVTDAFCTGSSRDTLEWTSSARRILSRIPCGVDRRTHLWHRFRSLLSFGSRGRALDSDLNMFLRGVDYLCVSLCSKCDAFLCKVA